MAAEFFVWTFSNVEFYFNEVQGTCGWKVDAKRQSLFVFAVTLDYFSILPWCTNLWTTASWGLGPVSKAWAHFYFDRLLGLSDKVWVSLLGGGGGSEGLRLTLRFMHESMDGTAVVGFMSTTESMDGAVVSMTESMDRGQ